MVLGTWFLGEEVDLTTTETKEIFVGGLLSCSNMHVSFLHLFLWLDSSF